MNDTIINGTYKLGPKIGAGSFGQIFSALNLKTQQEVAIKLEDVSSKSPQLLYESKLYQYLHSNNTEAVEGIPKMIQIMTYSHYNLLVMDLMGPSLEDLFALCNNQFSLKTVLMIADQLLSRAEFLHFKGFLHRDIKPDNFLIGTGKQQDIVHMIDFGLSKKFMKESKHIELTEGKKLTGTARYASINTHQGLEQSRRDDLESIGYTLIYLLKGSLPWQGVKANDKNERYNKIKDLKVQTSVEVLCKDLPKEFAEYMTYVKGLKFDEKPDYQKLKDLFKDLFYSKKFIEDFEFDWVIKAKEGKITLKNKTITTVDSRTTGFDIMLSSVDVKVTSGDAEKNKIQNSNQTNKGCFSLFSCFV